MGDLGKAHLYRSLPAAVKVCSLMPDAVMLVA
jgi:hypothetical protein